MILRRPPIAHALIVFLALAAVALPRVALAQRQLGPPPGADLEGTESEPQEKSQRTVDVPVPPPPGSSNAPTQPSPIPVQRPQPKTGPSGAAQFGRTGATSDADIPLDIPLDQIPNYRDRMRDIISELSRYARGRDPKFIVLARPGFDLLTWSQREFDLAEVQRDPTKFVPLETIRQTGTPMSRFIQTIDGFVLNGYFCAPLRVPRGDLAAIRGEGAKPLAVDQCGNEATAIAAMQAGARAGIVTYATTNDTAFGRVPKHRPVPENAANVEALGAAKNMLFLLSAKEFPAREDWLGAMQNNNYDVLVIDAFDRKDRSLTKAELHQLKFKQTGSRRLVIARIDVGYADETKFYWQPDWTIGKPSWIVGANPDSPGQYALEFWNPAWKTIVGKYLAGLIDLGFDGVMLDGVEAYRRWETKTPISPKR